MERKLTKTDCGELEFQLGYYTGMTCKVIAHNHVTIDIAIVLETTGGSVSELEYLLQLKYDEDGHPGFDQLQAIHGYRDEENMMNYTFAIDHALTIFYRMMGWEK